MMFLNKQEEYFDKDYFYIYEMTNKKISFVAQLLAVSFLITACKKDCAVPEKTIIFVNTYYMAHKGGGGKPYGPYQENTLQNAKYGFSELDGIEIDIQKSKDGTIWLFHDEKLDECGSFDFSCIPAATDEEILQLKNCLGADFTFTKLEEIFAYHREKKLNKKISLDCKSSFPLSVLSSIDDPAHYYEKLATEIIRLVKKYDMQNFIFVESETSSFLDKVKAADLNGLEIYLTTFGDFEKGMDRALKAGYQGLSYRYDPNEKLSKGDINRLHLKGLKIQMWTVNEKSDLVKAAALLPDYIQTDNVKFQ